MYSPLVSIIVPVYQAESFLKESVSSILNQTLQDIEIILINDGSTDHSGLLCDDIAKTDKRVVVIHQPNAGQSAARNVGMKRASGKYIGFMDNDDFLLPNMCECLYNNAIKHNADISGGSYMIKDNNGDITNKSHSQEEYLFDNVSGMENYLKQEKIDLYVWTKLYKRDFIKNNLLHFEEGRSEEDWLFNHSAFFVANSIIVQDIPIYIYWERSNSTCHTFHKKHLHKYLDDTCYRIKKIENEISLKYPLLITLAKRQTISACFRMLFIISKNSRIECEPYYSRIKSYLRQNSKQVIKEHDLWGMSKTGTILAAYTPPTLYFHFKKWKHANDIL